MGKITTQPGEKFKPRGFPFNMYLTDIDGKSLEKISRDGKKFVFCSNRNNECTRDTNIFIADWVE